MTTTDVLMLFGQIIEKFRFKEMLSQLLQILVNCKNVCCFCMSYT